VFRQPNSHTFQAIFGRDMLDPDRREHNRAKMGD
jgi:TetR/AcrR family transcriptional regulator